MRSGRNNDKAVIIWVCTILLLVIVAAGFTVGSGYVIKESVFVVFQVIVAASYSLAAILTVIALFKFFNVISVLLIAVNIALCFGKLYFLEYRFYHKLLFVLFWLSVLNLAIYLIYFNKIGKKRRGLESLHLVNAVIPVLYVGFSLFINAFQLLDLIETKAMEVHPAFVGIVLLIVAIPTVIVARTIRDRSDKKEYFGKLAAVFFGTLILLVAIPWITFEHTNYAFDKSTGKKTEFVVIEKDTKIRTKGQNGYYLTVILDDEELYLPVDKMTYMKYNVGDELCVYSYDGAYNCHYYEYRKSFVYKYTEE